MSAPLRFGRLLLAWTCLQCCVSGISGQAPADSRVGPVVTGRPIARIGIVADAQFCDCDASLGRFYRISLEKLHNAVDTFNAAGVDLVLNLGDLIDQRLESYPAALREIGRLEMPVHHLLGNHEFWEVPYHAQKGIYDTLGLSSGYCDILLPGWRLLLLDGTELAEYAQGAHPDLDEEGALCRASLRGQNNDAVWNGAIGNAQLAWIEWQLQEAAKQGEKVALFCHFPISPPGHSMTLWNEADLRLMLSKYPVAQVWFAGHSHGGGYQFLQGLHHLTFEGMLMTPDSNSFAILNIFPDQIAVEGYGREAYRMLPTGELPAIGETIFPDTLPPPDAMPEPSFPCVHRRVLDASGRVVLDEYLGGNEAAASPKLKPGCFEVMEESEGRWTLSRWVVVPNEGD